MKKQLVEAGNLDAFICQATSALYADSSMILTPGAKDELARRHIAIIREKKPFASCGAREICPVQACDPQLQSTGGSPSCEDERLLLGVAAMVKEEFGIDDSRLLYDMSTQFVRVLKNLSV